MKKSILTALFCGAALLAQSQNFYDLNTIQRIEVVFPNNNWDTQLDTSNAGADSYIMAFTVTINGTIFDSVGGKV